ncbi:mRNA surveillance protein pelota [Candidatus Woesearchaeota archaeon]|nr:mRNA surveillance protein pelota [Candidatus Woesearchaeota archaeon]
MKTIYSNLKKGEIKLKVENPDDFWYLTTIIDKGDLVKGKTIRKIKIGEKEQRSMKTIKKPVFIAVNVEKVEFSKTSGFPRVAGVVTEGPEDVPHGSHHTFNIEVGSIITIIKKKWLTFQLDRLKEASSKEIAKILICILDREESFLALLKRYGYTLLSHIKGKVQKKGVEEKVTGSLYSEIIKKIEDYDKKYTLNQIIIASPAFWKEELMKELKNDELKKKIILATCSSIDKTAINEVLKRPETREALKQARASKEANLVEELLTEISKQGLAAYGLKETENAANSGAVKMLLVTDSLIQKSREENKYEKIDQIMKTVDSTKGEVHLISSENDAGKKLDGLGGIGGILRYKLNY